MTTQSPMSAEEFERHLIHNGFDTFDVGYSHEGPAFEFNHEEMVKLIRERDAQIRTLAREQGIEECALFIESHAIYPHMSPPWQKFVKPIYPGKSFSMRQNYAAGVRALKTPKHDGATK